MSDGLKHGLIIGGAGLVAFLIWKNSQASAAAVAAGVPTVPGSGTTMSPAPGATASATTAAAAATPAATSSASTGAKIVKALPTAIGKGVAFAVTEPYQIAKSVGTSIGGAIKSIF